MGRISRIFAITTGLWAAAAVFSCSKDVEMEFVRFVDDHTEKIGPVEKELSLAYWDAALSGATEDFDRYSKAQMEYETIYTNSEEFEFVRSVRESGKLKDPVYIRMADVLYLRYLGNQVDPDLLAKIVDLSARVEKEFNVFRAEVDGKKLTTNEVYEILKTADDPKYRRKVWEASKMVGKAVEDDLLELVRLRNEMAGSIGFDNYYVMSLSLGEQDEGMLAVLFDELDRLTREPFVELKEEIDSELASRYGIGPDEIRPWHYTDPFFQDVLALGGIDLDRLFEGRNVVELATDFFRSIGMPVEDIIESSDLYEREGKNPHAFCTDIDRRGDIRILGNVKDDSYWMETMLHELGHGVYDKYIDRDLPYLLRIYPHLAVTEASAMYFGRFVQDPKWLMAVLGLGGDEVGAIEPALERALRMKQLVFSRWTQVMFRFERELYRDPDRDLNALWWDIVEEYQLIKRPEGRSGPDWAAKKHIVSNPVYYHNYMLGEMIASQVHHHISTEVQPGLLTDGGIYGNLVVGEYLREKFYRPGNSLVWTEHVKALTGESLTAKYFVSQFVEDRN
jgi:peptidyl-dipeptidase A